jgi:hypothetical protein
MYSTGGIMNIYGITEKDMAEPGFPDENAILESLIKTMREVLDGDSPDPAMAALGVSIDFFVLDHYMRNGRIPTAWRK